jgi:thiamine-phosphate pyrophosphorylase
VSTGPSERAGSPIVVLVTDPRYDRARTEAVLREAAALLGGDSVFVQVRDKEATSESLLAQARALRNVTRAVGAHLVVNGSLAIARQSAADGVHLPGRHTASDLASACASAREWLGPRAIVTVAAHDDEDIHVAALAGASAALVSPIFDVPGKGASRGVAALTSARAVADAARQQSPLALLALGGVTGSNAAACIGAGADGVAAIRALYDDGGELLRALAALAVTGRSPRRPGP